MTDIVDRLKVAKFSPGLILEAAAEIERLRAALLKEVQISNQCGGLGEQCSGWGAVKCGCAGEARATLKGGEDGGEGNPAPGDWLRAQRLGGKV